jgi:hypothetical protein
MRVFYLIPLLCVALFLTLVVNPISYAQISVSSEWKARNVFENLPQSQTENITAQNHSTFESYSFIDANRDNL